jgi:hypothetical protein
MSTLESSVIDPGNFFVRLFFMAVYFLILSVVRFILWGVLLVQILYHLFGGGVSPGAQRIGQAVSEYVYRIWLFLTYNTNERPFPFANWKD